MGTMPAVVAFEHVKVGVNSEEKNLLEYKTKGKKKKKKSSKRAHKTKGRGDTERWSGDKTMDRERLRWRGGPRGSERASCRKLRGTAPQGTGVIRVNTQRTLVRGGPSEGSDSALIMGSQAANKRTWPHENDGIEETTVSRTTP